MLTRLSNHFCMIALCTLVSSPWSYGDEREELKLRIVELKKHAAQLMEEGRKDKAEGLIREQQELMEKLNRMNSEGPSKGKSKGSGPSPEQMEKFARAMQQVQHLRIASEHLKLAGMHDMAMDLMRRAEDIEQDLRNAKEKMAEHMRGPKDQPQRDQPQRDQPQRDQPRRDRPERIRPEGRGPEARFNGPEARFIGPDARFNGPDARFNGPDARFNGPEARFNGIEQQLEQLRNENQKLRMMIEKIASGMGQSDRPDKP